MSCGILLPNIRVAQSWHIRFKIFLKISKLLSTCFWAQILKKLLTKKGPTQRCFINKNTLSRQGGPIEEPFHNNKKCEHKEISISLIKASLRKSPTQIDQITIKDINRDERFFWLVETLSQNYFSEGPISKVCLREMVKFCKFA